ncbi:MAG: hypothetical protein WBG57_00580, partial [Ornithinimicrobium sp.]
MRREELPTALEAVLEGRGAALFRTAVLLERDRDAAIGLVARAMTKAGRGRRGADAPPEARVRDLVVADFVASSRRGSIAASMSGGAGVLADPLSGL